MWKAKEDVAPRTLRGKAVSFGLAHRCMRWTRHSSSNALACSGQTRHTRPSMSRKRDM